MAGWLFMISTAHARPSVRPDTSSRVQILSLGAGFDTLFFRLAQQSCANLCFTEVDCTEIVTAKTAIITDASVRASLLAQENHDAAERSSNPDVAVQWKVPALQASYSLLACDLGDQPRLESALDAVGLDKTLPTLIIAECVVVSSLSLALLLSLLAQTDALWWMQSYLDPTKGTNLLQWLAMSFSDAVAAIYDPIALNDPFGQTLQSYFSVKGCELRSLAEFQSASDHFQRLLLRAEWNCCRILDMNAIFAGCTVAAEKQRVSSLEVFDEFVDWMICNAHYAFFLVSTAAAQPRWVSAFCGGDQVARAMEATRISTRSSSVALIRTFQPQDKAAAQQLFADTHLEYANKAVKKFVANRLRSGDMAEIDHSFMRPAKAGQSCFWVAVMDDKVVGCIAVMPHADDQKTAELCRLSVHPNNRRMGIASALVSQVESFARAKGFEAIALETIGTMEAAQHLYTAHGYHKTETETFTTFTLVRFHKHLKAHRT